MSQATPAPDYVDNGDAGVVLAFPAMVVAPATTTVVSFSQDYENLSTDNPYYEPVVFKADLAMKHSKEEESLYSIPQVSTASDLMPTKEQVKCFPLFSDRAINFWNFPLNS